MSNDSYMKRLIATAVIMMLAVISVTAEPATVEEIDGHNWRLWDTGQRITYVQGFYSAYSSIWIRMMVSFDGDQDEIDAELLEEYFYISLNVGTMVDRINEYYANYDNRDDYLYMVLMYMAGKDYWNSEQFQQKQPQNAEPNEGTTT